MSGMLDRGVAGRVGRALAGGGEDPGDPPPVDLIGVCDDAAARISAYARLSPVADLPTPEWIGRGAWIDLNVEALAPVLEAPLQRSGETLGPLGGTARALTGTIAGAEAGAVTGLLSQRVLGQVDPGLLRGPEHVARLVLVAPNLEHAAGKLSVDHADLVRWVAVHEMTHAVQFASVPWLRPELDRLLRETIAALEVRLDVRALLRLPRPEDLFSLVDLVRGGDLLRALAGEEARGLLDRVQSLMGLIEGHAEHVMDAVGGELVEDVGALREALEGRRRERSPLDVLLGRLLGLDQKLAQYRDGRAFCDHVVAEGGRRALRRAWDDPDTVPTPAELADPAAWLARVA